MDDWLTAGSDTHLPEPCGLGWALIGGVWAGAAVVGFVAAVIADRLTRRFQ